MPVGLGLELGLVLETAIAAAPLPATRASNTILVDGVTIMLKIFKIFKENEIAFNGISLSCAIVQDYIPTDAVSS